jgi:periplasmic protein TonB
LEQRGCTPASHEFLTDWLYKVSVVPKPSASSKSDLESICFPTGERGYVVSKGVKPPRAVSTPDPAYSESARHSRIQGTAIYALLVDEQGLVSDVLLVRSLEPSLNFNGVVALRKWRFKPATFEGEPIRGAVHVEVNFRLY